MRTSLVMLALLAGSVAACSDSTGSSGPDRLYSLDELDGAPPPGFVAIFGTAAVVESGLLTLHANGQAKWVAEVVDTSDAARDSTITAQLVYHIQGDSIRIEPSIPCRGTCAKDEVGAVSENTLTLTFDESPRSGPVYHFTRIAVDPH